jgi:hypothetical protein
VKYETVMGTIGKTHGVKSEGAPTLIASQMNDHTEPLPAGPLVSVPNVNVLVPMVVLPALAEFV